MYRSTSYASQTGRTVFVEMATRSGETARLLRGIQVAQPARPRWQVRFLAGRAAIQAGRALGRLRKRTPQVGAAARA